MKKILMLTDGWKRFITYAWTAGIMEYIRKNGKDIAFEQYHSWGNWSRDDAHNRGEYGIFSLPDLSEYDGIILDVTNITDSAVRDELVSYAAGSGLPVVSICFELENSYYVGVDGYSAVTAIMDHLVEKHGCRTFHFAGGSADNFENQVRQKAFEDSFRRHGLNRSESTLSYGDYEAKTGVRYIRSLADQLRDGEYGKIRRSDASENENEADFRAALRAMLPDAIVCANDNIAVGVITELERYGIEVPEDVRVTGFDNFDKAAYFNPQISTASLDRQAIGYRCAETLDQIWNGGHPDRHQFVYAETIFSESCGCPNSGRINYREYLKNQILAGMDTTDQTEVLADVEARLSGCADTESFAREITEIYGEKDVDGVKVVLDDRLEHPVAGTEFAERYEDRSRFRTYAETAKEGAEEQTAGTNDLFIPLHIGAGSVGYVRLRNPRFIYSQYNFYEIQDVILRVLRSVYSSRQLQDSLNRLSEIYDKDQLTGLYARTAYNTKLTQWFSRWVAEGKRVAVCFIDADNFKELNDTHGHDYGDEVLIQIGKSLLENIPEEGFACRYGGDEFLASFVCDGPQDMEKRMNAVIRGLRGKDVEVSVGMIVAPEEGMGDTLDANVSEADRRMYEIKKLHHAARL